MAPSHAFAFTRRGRAAHLDPVRGFLVEATPEETVRQALIVRLITEFGVPLEALRIECPVQKYGGRSRGRADVVVVNGGQVLMTIECKEPGTLLHDGVLDQATAYADEVSADLLAMTNGSTLVAMIRDHRRWTRLAEFPDFAQMHAPRGLPVAPPPSRDFKTLSYRLLLNRDFLRRNDAKLSDDWGYAVLGEDTPRELWTPIYLLYHAVMHSPVVQRALPRAEVGFSVKGLIGTHFTEYGNYSGGSFPGLYASFIVDDGSGDDRVFKIGFFACARTRNDPKFGNRRGTSGVHVSVDDEHGGHMSLELSLDACLRLYEGSADVVHDGKITVGRLGAAKRSLLLDYVADHAPHLVDGNNVALGSFPTSHAPTFDDVGDVVFNLLHYAHIRELFRRDYKSGVLRCGR